MSGSDTAGHQAEPIADKSTGGGGIAQALVTGRALILLQLLSRLLTFALNQGLIRLAPPEVFGTAAIQFDLICSTILFLSREGIRNALLRAPTQTQDQAGDAGAIRERQSGALATVPIWLGLVISTLVTSIYLRTSASTTTSQRSFHLSLGLYVLSALLELSIEPWYIRSLRGPGAKLRVRVQAEGGMAIVKAVVTFGSLYLNPDRPLLSFALGQVSGALFLATRYVWEYGAQGLVWPGKLDKAPRFDPSSTSLAIANTRQSVVKHLLTEADRIAVGRISPLREQGGYAIAMNYGSLIARILFQPLEETLLLHFSSTDSSSSTVAPLLSFILHISSHLLLFLPSFLPPLLPPILRFVLPRRYLITSAPQTLEQYLSWYIPLMSLNGILEAFHAATASPAQIKRQEKWMMGSSVAFVGSLYLHTLNPSSSSGNALEWISGMSTEQGLIMASCTASLVRIGYAISHARFKTGLSLRALVPRYPTSMASIISGLLLRRVFASGRWLQSFARWCELMGLGAVLGVLTLLVMWTVEKESFRRLQVVLRDKEKSQ